MTKILCIGDSWTDPNYPEYDGIKTWAEYFDCDIIARYACSNDWIFDSFCRYHETYDKIIILWSEWHRHGLTGKAHTFSKTDDVLIDILKTPNYMYAVDKIRGNNVFQMQGPDIVGYGHNTQKEIDISAYKACKHIIDRDITSNVHGWPCMEEIGGFNCRSLLNKSFPNKSWKLSKDNGHPNTQGHQFIYEYIRTHANIQ